MPGRGARREEVCKYIDVTTCIGCKACEVACVEWNDHPFRETTFDNTYQTMPTTEWNYWNLIKFAEDERDGNLMWLMRKDQCMHCEDPGCLRACPADGAIVKYENGIVDFQQENCIGCGYCISGCPFDIPKFNPKTKKVYKCTLCSDRVGQGLEPACIKACPTGCLKFGTKTDMVQIAGLRAKQLREVSGFANAGVYDPQSIGGTHVIYVLHDIKRPERYGLPANPVIPPSYTYWKWLAKPTGLGMGLLGIAAVFFHRVFYGPKLPQPEPPEVRTGPQEEIEAGRKESHERDHRTLTRRRGEFARIGHYACSSRRVVASSGLHAVPALVGCDLLHPLAAYRVCDLLAVALPLDHAAVWRWTMTRWLHPWFGLLFEFSSSFSSSTGLRRWHGPEPTGVG